MLYSNIIGICVAAAFSALTQAQDTSTQCSGLVSIQLTRGVHIVNATYISSDQLNATSASTGLNFTSPFCWVNGQVNVLNQSTVNFQVWLPEQNYNGRFLAVGNGGLAGIIDQAAMLLGLEAGFAVAGGDSGHLQSLNGNGNPQPGVYLPYLHNEVQTLEWIRDSIAAFTVPARAIQTAYYGQTPLYSYYTGCSTGGAQAFALAQRHPDLFDGIYAQCPGNWYSHLVLMFLWNQVHASGAGFMDQPTLNFITDQVLAQCDELDGVKDNMLEDPFQCNFNVSSLQCADGQAQLVNNQTTCLTAAQVKTAQAFYQGPRDTRNGNVIYPGFVPGSESSWYQLETTLASIYSAAVLQNLVFSSSYNISNFNFGSDVDLVDSKAGSKIDHISTDFMSFFNHGGKLIMAQGLADPLNPPTWPVDYLAQISNVTTNAPNYIRLFNIPGAGHCGPSAAVPQAPATVHYIQPLMDWVEKGKAPTEIKVSNPADGSGRTRKLCPYPETAQFNGGDSDDWTSFSCS